MPTARQRQNIIDLCKLIGYRLDTPIAATTTLQFSVPAPLGADLVVPAGTACRALLEDGLADFETVEDGLIPRGVLTVNVPARQGVQRTETFTATGQPFQRFRLNGEAIAQGSIYVTIGDETWNEVGHFQDSAPDSLHFMADTDAPGCRHDHFRRRPKRPGATTGSGDQSQLSKDPGRKRQPCSRAHHPDPDASFQ